MNKQKRMIYVYEENVEFYDNLENKSEFINKQLSGARRSTTKPGVPEDTSPGMVARNANLDFVKKKLKAIDERKKR